MKRLVLAIAVLLLSSMVFAAEAPTAVEIDNIYPTVEPIYLDLHQNPELSFQEQKTSAKVADHLRKIGYEVTTGVGRTGVVAILKNNAGPVSMLRTDMDALPVEEKTGLPYASKVKTKNATGEDVPVMHACGHDLHMAALIGTATYMAQNKQRWHGTLMLIGQPAEELVEGARAMLADGLFQRWPKPAFAIAVHDTNNLPAGKVGYVPGFALSATDSVDVTIHGKGGHGASPQTTVDPIVIAARTILALQTIISREVDPQEAAVITVGSVHAGTKNNIIPDEARLQITVRSFKPEIREHLRAAIQRVVKAEAAAADAPKEPDIKITPGANATYNDPKLTQRLVAALRAAIGEANVLEQRAIMASEDFSEFGQAGVPASMLMVGAADPTKFAEAQKAGTALPSLHSPLFAPDYPRALRTAMMAEVTALLELLR